MKRKFPLSIGKGKFKEMNERRQQRTTDKTRKKRKNKREKEFSLFRYGRGKFRESAKEDNREKQKNLEERRKRNVIVEETRRKV